MAIAVSLKDGTVMTGQSIRPGPSKTRMVLDKGAGARRYFDVNEVIEIVAAEDSGTGGVSL